MWNSRDRFNIRYSKRALLKRFISSSIRGIKNIPSVVSRLPKHHSNILTRFKISNVVMLGGSNKDAMIGVANNGAINSNHAGAIYNRISLTSLVFVFIASFCITFIISKHRNPMHSTEATINNSYSASITISGNGSSPGELNFTVQKPPEGGTLAVGKQMVNLTTNAPHGAELYLSSGGDTAMGNSASSRRISAHNGTFVSPQPLNINTWGYALPNDMLGNSVSTANFSSQQNYEEATNSPIVDGSIGTLKFSGIKSDQSMEKIYIGPTKTFPVFIGALPGGDLPEGNYSTHIYYTVVVEAADGASGGFVVTPNKTSNLSGGELITISTSFKLGTNNGANNYGSSGGLLSSDISVSIGDATCTETTVISSGSEPLKIQCKAPGKSAGKYRVEVRISKAGKIYGRDEAFEYGNSIPSGDPVPLPELTSLQDGRLAESCKIAQEHATARLKDLRDGNYYNIVKGKDGKCWMAQNLRLHLNPSITLTPATSDVFTDWTPSHITQMGDGTAGFPTWPTSKSGNPRSHDSGIEEYGVYYNWSAATAGTGKIGISPSVTEPEAPASICPRGWRLPRNDQFGNSSLESNDVKSLINAYDNNGNQAYSAIATSPFAAAVAGYYQATSGSIVNRDTYSHFWGSIPAFLYSDSIGASYLVGTMGFSKSSHSPGNVSASSIYLHEGASIRCVAREDGLNSKDLTKANYLQDVTEKMCNATHVGTRRELMDYRDNNKYWVAKAKDGKCWMAQNLRLQLKVGKALTPDTSDVRASWMPIHNTMSGNNNYSTFIDQYREHSHYFGVAQHGVHYTWSAATAGKGNSIVTTQGQSLEDSVCPRGWRLPRSGPTANIFNDFYALTNNYGGTSSSGSIQLRSSPLFFQLSGLAIHNNKQIQNSNAQGYFWSSTAHDSTSAYSLYIDGSTVNPMHLGDRRSALTVRCIIREDIPASNAGIASATYMQDVTKEMCDSTPEGTEKSLIDRRDNNSYRVIKAKDGKCWMGQNLQFKMSAGVALQPETSDVSTAWTPVHTTKTTTVGDTFSDNGKEYSHHFGNSTNGTYYTWTAATAGGGNINALTNGQNMPNSVCPKGWKLPRGGPNSDPTNDFYGLTQHYHSPNQLINDSLRLPFSGMYNHNNGQLDEVAGSYFWSSSASLGSESAYYLHINSANIYPNYTRIRKFGFPVRCVVRTGDPIGRATYLQDVTKDMCDATPEDTEKFLLDKRDNKSYKIVKARDGRCWMAQNLRLNLNTGIALTPDTSDVQSPWTPNYITQIGSGTTGFANWSASDLNTAYSHDASEVDYGVLYSWNAATAGSGNSSISTQNQNTSASICPKGWKLPRSGNNDYENNDFERLTRSYGGNINIGDNPQGASNLISLQPSFALAGIYSNGSIVQSGRNGNYWSSTVHDYTQAFTMSLSANYVNASYAYYRHYGLSVRCLIR